MKFYITSTIEIEAKNKKIADDILWNEQHGVDTKEIANDLLRNAEIEKIED